MNRCQACGHDNPAEAAFCGNCGGNLSGREAEAPPVGRATVAFRPQPAVGVPAGPPVSAPPYPGAPLPGPAPQPAYGAVLDPFGRPLASWGSRLGAYLIDSVLLSTVFAVTLFIFIGIVAALFTDDFTGEVNDTGNLLVGLYVLFFLPLTSLLYFALGNGGARGQTIGKRATGIEVRSLVTGGPIGFFAALGRAFILWIPLLGMVSGLWPLWDPKGQGLHDKAVKSLVRRR